MPPGHPGCQGCRQVTPAVKAEIGQILKDTQGKKVVTAKRPFDAAATATGLASATAAVAASKRTRSSLSSGPGVGAGGLAAAFGRLGEIGNDARASMALADLIHSEGLSGYFAKKPKVLAALQAFKNTSRTYATPGRKQVDGPLLGALSGQYGAYALNHISQHKEDCGMAVVSDGATVNHISLINVPAVALYQHTVHRSHA